MRNIIRLILTTFITAVFASHAFAQEKTAELVLRAKPNDSAKIVSKIKANQAITPFYKKDGWFKVGLPNNGDVGWIKETTLSQTPQPIIIKTVTTNNEDNGKKKSEKVSVFSASQLIDKKQMKDFWQEMSKQQQEMNSNLQQMINDSSKMFNSPEFFDWMKKFPTIIIKEPATNKDKQ